MAYEDFTTYVEIDPNSNITVGANSVTHDVRRDEDAYVYKDFGPGNFDDFVLFATATHSLVDYYAYYWFCVFSNTVDDVKGLIDGGQPYVGLFFYGPGMLVLEYFDGAVRNQDDYPTAVVDTPYYLVISRANDSLTCRIYSDADRTTLLDTLQVDVTGSPAFRYLFATNTYNSGSAIEGTLVVADVDLCPLPEWRSPTSVWQAACGGYTLCWQNLDGIRDDDLETAAYLDGWTFNDPADVYVKWDPPILAPDTLRLWYAGIPASIYNSVSVLYDPGGWALVTVNGFSGSPMSRPLDPTRTISQARISVVKTGGWGWQLRGDLLFEIKILDGIPCTSIEEEAVIARTYFFLA